MLPVFSNVKISGLSPYAQISVLTLDPGSELYAVFGHTAIRVLDHAESIDIVFNFGTFDFDTKFFYLKFLKGNLQYYITKYNFSSLQYELLMEQRSLYEQKLNIPYQAKLKLYHFLDSLTSINYSYPYEFFLDNCATRVRDVIEMCYSDTIMYNYTNFGKSKNYRELIEPYLYNQPFLLSGMNLILGPAADKIPSQHDYMFLPYYLMHAFINARIIRINEIEDTISGEPVLLFEAFKEHTREKKSGLVVTCTFLMLVIGLTIYETMTQYYTKWVDVVMFILTGLLGLLILFLWFWSSHIELQRNLNILWANPLNLLLVILLFLKYNRHLLPQLLTWTLIFLKLCFFAGVMLNYQHVPIAVFPLVIALIIRELAIVLQSKSYFFK